MAQKKKQKLPKISLGLCCYCCGEPVGDTFILASMSSRVDRVFILRQEHVALVDGGIFMKVKEHD